MPIHIKEVEFGGKEYKGSLKLRHDVLRVPLGLELTTKDTAIDDKEFQILAFDGDVVIGCVLLRPITTEVIKLRQMAVYDAYQGQGIGAKLVRYAEELATKRGFKSVETHARKYAQMFYEKLGYRAEGDEFTEVTIATIKMCKRLAQG